jgi:hypothetical protein
MSNFCLQTNINSYVIKIYSPSVQRTVIIYELYGTCESFYFILSTNFVRKCFQHAAPTAKNFFFTTCLGEISQQVKLLCNRLDNQDIGVWFLTWQEIFLFSKASKPYVESIQPSVQLVLRPGTHYPHVTWAHVMLRVWLGCDRRFNFKLYGADSHFCHSAYVTWSRVELWSAHVSACLWEVCWHVCRPELHARSRDISRVTEVWICTIEFNVKSLLTSQPLA